MTRQSVIILDDGGVLRDGLVAVFENSACCKPVVAAGSPGEAESLARSLSAPVVVANLEARAFDTIDASRRVRRIDADTRILGLTHGPTDTQILLCGRVGFDGFATLDQPAETIIGAALKVGGGEKVLSEFVLERREHLQNSPLGEPKAGRLTARELQVVRLTALGLSTGEIGERNQRSHRTVENQLQSAMRKIEARSRIDLVRWAIRERLAQP